MSREAAFSIFCLVLFIAWMVSVAIDEHNRKDDDA